MPHPENEARLFLSCPSCAGVLGLGAVADTLTCPSQHTFTLQTLLLGQSIQANVLFTSGLELLQQQIKLVRSIALELSVTDPKTFLQLEVQADKLDKVVADIKAAMKYADHA